MQEVVAKIGDPLSDLLRRPYVDPLLELVDLVVQRVDEVEEVLGDQVDDLVHDLTSA